MPLEDLLIKVKQDRAQEEQKMQAEHKCQLQALEKKKTAEISRLENELAQAWSEKKERLLRQKEKAESFRLAMERLALKKELLEQAQNQALEKLVGLDFGAKKDLFLNRLKEELVFLKEAEEIVVPHGKKQAFSALLELVGLNKTIREDKLAIKEGMLARGKNWSLTISLAEILQQRLNQDKKKFIDILFQSL